MHPLVKHHVHINRFFTAITVLIIGGLMIYFILRYRLTQVAEYLVSQQTHGQFALTVDQLQLSPWKGRIEAHHTRFIPRDSLAGNRFIAEVPALYLTIHSWKELLLDKKLSFDSIRLTSPSFEVFEAARSPAGKKVGFESAFIFDALNNAVRLLNVRYFNLKGGSFTYHFAGGQNPFRTENIDLSIRNFGPSKNDSSKFLAADDIEMSLPGQHWVLADSSREIRFRQLRFSSRKQIFELDSCGFTSRDGDGKDYLELNMDHLSLKAQKLSAFYENNEVLIDTLICTHPVLQLHLDKDKPTSDTVSVINESLRSIFTNLHVRFFNIDDGEFAIEEKANGKISHYASQRTDLDIEDLSIRPDESPFLTTGDIRLNLTNVNFFTPDSLYQLSVEEFGLYNTDINFKDAVFSPTQRSRGEENFLVRIPLLTLRKLELEKLFERQLKAGIAELDSPRVDIVLGAPDNSQADSVNAPPGSGNWSGFYSAMHGLNELLQVRMLNVKNGFVKIHSVSDSSLHAAVNGFTISVLLNDFLKSTSLMEIKKAIPLLEVVDMDVHSSVLAATITQLKVEGSSENSFLGKVHFSLQNGIAIEAEEIFWRMLDWEALRNYNAIIVDSVAIGELAFISDQVRKRRVTDQPLPIISIARLDLNKFKVSYKLPAESMMEAKGKNFSFTCPETVDNRIEWRQMNGVFSSFEYKSPEIKASADKIKVDAPGETQFTDVKLDIKNKPGVVSARIPEIKIATPFSSTDFSVLEFPYLVVNRPRLNVFSVADSSKKGALEIPFDVSVKDFKMNGGQLNYMQKEEDDTLHLNAVVNVSATLLNTDDTPDALSFKSTELSLTKVAFENGKVKAAVQELNFTLENGRLFSEEEKATLEMIVQGKWSGISFGTMLKNEGALQVNDLSGSMSTASLKLQQDKKISWNEFLDKVTVSNGGVAYSDSTKSISFRHARWIPAERNIEIDSFLFEPKLTPLAYFAGTQWQSDYIRLNGRSLLLSNFDVHKWTIDSSLDVSSITLSDYNIDVWRDKRIPFRHGFDKLMPTQLINSSRHPVSIDSMVISNSNITYHEISSITNREGIVPLEDVNAVIKNIRNHHDKPDTLTLTGKMKLLSSNIRRVRYQEAYDDSLSSFKLVAKASPADLTEFSRITNPLAAIDIHDGRADTMIARISGNKYAAVGEMQFYYHDLKVSMLDHEDTARKRLSLAFVNFVANKFVVRTNNEKSSSIFFIRDQEKFVFNYWIKSVLSGMLTSAGIRRDNAYRKQYLRLKDEYDLPEVMY